MQAFCWCSRGLMGRAIWGMWVRGGGGGGFKLPRGRGFTILEASSDAGPVRSQSTCDPDCMRQPRGGYNSDDITRVGGGGR